MRVLNNTMADIYINTNGSSYVVPMAVEVYDVDGNKSLQQGACDVPTEDLAAVEENPVVLYYFNEKMLELGKEPEPAEPTAVELALKAVADAEAVLAAAADKAKPAAQKALDEANAALVAAQGV